MIYYPVKDQYVNYVEEENNTAADEEEEEEWDREAFLDPMWELQQKKTFTAWCNSHLRKANIQISNIEQDFCHGLNLIYLLETLSGESLPKPDKGNMRFHKIANVNKALNYIESRGVQLINVGAEEIVDGNVKMTLGMIWTIILRYAIQDITVEEMSAKEGLLLWCKRKTAPYKNVNVQNFHMSWKDGLAFCALIHRHRPELIDYSKLSRDNPIENLNYAFDVAEKYLDIPKMLDAEDMINTIKPDERSVMAYVSSYYHAFAGAQKAETAANRICKVLQVNQDNENLMNAYEHLASDLLDWINKKLPFLRNRTTDNTLPGTKGKLEEFRKYRGLEKPPKYEIKGELETIYNTLQTRLRLSNRPPYLPTEDHMINDIQAAWKELDKNEKGFEDWLVAEIQRLERLEYLVKKFNLKCDTHEAWAHNKDEICKYQNFKDIGLCELKNLLKLHVAFEADLGAHQGRVERIVAIAEELNTLGYDKIDTINNRTQNIANQWDILGETTSKNRAALLEAIKAKEEIDSLQLDYAKRISPFYNWLEQAEEDLQDMLIISSLQEINKLISGHETFKTTLPNAESELKEILQLRDRIHTLIENNGFSASTAENPYSPISIKDLKDKWVAMNYLVPQRDAALQAEVTKQQRIDKLKQQFAQFANQAGPWLEKENDIINTVLAQSKLHLDAQRAKLTKIEEEILAFRPRVDELENLHKTMQSMVILDNSYTAYTMDTIRVGWEQNLTSVRKAINEVDNQILTRDTKGVSEAQMSEFRKCFNHFDRNRTRKLDLSDFKACLVSLGFRLMKDVKNDADFRRIASIVDPNHTGFVTFEAFIDFVTKENSDNDSVEQMTKSFSVLANDQVKPSQIFAAYFEFLTAYRLADAGLEAYANCLYNIPMFFLMEMTEDIFINPFITKDVLLRELPPNQAKYCIDKMPPYRGPNSQPDALDYRLFSNRLYGESDL